MSTRQYIGARYVPKFYQGPNGNQWTPGISYEALTVVTYLNNSYTSMVPVPATQTTPNLDTEHWVLTGAYNQQVEQYRQEVLDVANKVNSFYPAFGTLYNVNYSKILIVSKTGGMFTTINDAINYAKQYANIVDRVLILIAPGVYRENITLFHNPGIDLQGSGRTSTFILSDAAYPDAALHTTGWGVYSDISFESTGTNAYALHIEYFEDTSSTPVIFQNCAFIASKNAGVGIGFGPDHNIEFRNCYIGTSNPTSPALFIHNNNEPATNMQFKCYYCNFYSYQEDIIFIGNQYRLAGGTGGKSVCNTAICFNGCTGNQTNIKFQKDSTTTLSYIPDTDDSNFTIMPFSDTNAFLGLDSTRRRKVLQIDVITRVGGYVAMPMMEATRYDWTVDFAEIRNNDGTTTTTTAQIVGPSYDTLNIHIDGVSDMGTMCTITISGVPK